MEDPSAGRHPLHVASPQRPAVSQAVAVIHRTGQHVRDRLDAAVRMPRESRPVRAGVIVSEIVQQEKRIELGRVAEAERSS
jgi:hypothetical protein